MSPVDLHLQQSSLQVQDTPKQVRADLPKVLSHGADLIGFTEVLAHVKDALRAACRRADYRLATTPSDCAIAVRDDHELVRKGYTPVLDAEPGPAAKGGHSRRGIAWVRVRIGDELVEFNEAHWLTGWGTRPQQRRDEHLAMTRAMIDRVHDGDDGRALAFFAGDVNVRELIGAGRDPQRPDWRFNAAGLLTIHDEMGELYGTHRGHAIDVVGRSEADKRVRATGARAWPQLHKDHRDLSAFYRIVKRA